MPDAGDQLSSGKNDRVEHAVRTAGLGLSSLTLGVAVQLMVAPEHIYERAFDLFNSAVLVAGLSLAAVALWPNKLVGKLLGSLALTLLPVMIWFRELPRSWESVLWVVIFVVAFCAVLALYWLIPQIRLELALRSTYPRPARPALANVATATTTKPPVASTPSRSTVANPESLARFSQQMVAAQMQSPAASPRSLSRWNQLNQFSSVLGIAVWLAFGAILYFLNAAGVTNRWLQIVVVGCAVLSVLGAAWSVNYVYRAAT